MKPKPGTKIFGITVKGDPKIMVGGLALLLGGVLWYNMSGGSSDGAPQSASTARATEVVPSPAPVPFVRNKGRNARRSETTAERAVLRITAVDASDGRIDPTLRTDLLARLQTVEPLGPGRSLFETGAAATPAEQTHPPVIIPVHRPPAQIAAQSTGPVTPQEPQMNIPLRYYGFVNPASKREAARGLFMSGENILVAKEGEQLEGHFLVVSLSPNHARMEDTQMHQGQILPVAPEASDQ